jgi:uncharacterized protein YciW
MATYAPITKTLVKAVPTKRASDNFVTRWEIEVNYAYAGDADADPVQPAWDTDYSESVQIETPEKVATGYTRAELIAMMPAVIDDHVFHAHYEAFNLAPAEPEESAENDFDLDTLG